MDRADKPQRRVSHPEPQPVLNNMRLKHRWCTARPVPTPEGAA